MKTSEKIKKLFISHGKRKFIRKKSVLFFFILILFIFSSQNLFSYIFQFRFKKDDIIMITSRMVENIFVDDKLAKVWRVETLAKLFVKEYDESSETALIEGKYSFYEISEDKKDKTLVDFQEVEFYQKQSGEMIFKKDFLYPTLRSSPAFLNTDIPIGGTWWYPGEEIQDFSNFGLSGLIAKIPINVCYTYVRDEKKEGKDYSIIKAQYDLAYSFEKDKTLQYYFKTGDNVPQYFGGNVMINYYWDRNLGYAPYYEQVFDLFLIMADGTRYKFSGTSSGEMNVIRKWNEEDKKALAEQIAKELKAQYKDIEVRSEKKGIVIDLGEILFDFDSDKIKPEELEKLITIGKIIQKYFPDYQVIVEGYTDDKGSEAYNLELSKKRAYAVYQMLISLGFVSPDLISYIGYGEQFPKYPNTTEENRKKNRRVQIVITDF